MRIVFMGTPRFASIVLERLVSEFDVVGVFTQPDAIRKRGKTLSPSPVKECALDHLVPVYEYSTLGSDNDAFERLQDLNPDVICVAAYGVLLPRTILDLPTYGCLNVHASLLPKWRGAAPIERAILSGDESLGVCVMKMEEGLDTGDYCCIRSTPRDHKTSEELTVELAHLGAEALSCVLHALNASPLEWIKQDDTKATLAPKIKKGELDIDPSMTSDCALRCIQASSFNHPCKADIAGKMVSIKSACPAQSPDILSSLGLNQFDPGALYFLNKHLYLAFVDGLLEITELQPAGKRAMAAKDFAAGIQGIKQQTQRWGALDDQAR